MAPPKSLRDQVGRFLQSLRFEDTVEPPSGGVVWSTPTRLIVLDAKEREAFEKTCSLIRDYYGPDGQWSLDAVESHLRDAVFAATDEDAAADKVRQKAILDQLFEAMSRPIVR